MEVLLFLELAAPPPFEFFFLASSFFLLFGFSPDGGVGRPDAASEDVEAAGELRFAIADDEWEKWRRRTFIGKVFFFFFLFSFSFFVSLPMRSSNIDW